MWTNGSLHKVLCTVGLIIPRHTNLCSPVPIRKVQRMRQWGNTGLMGTPNYSTPTALVSHLDPDMPGTCNAVGVPVYTGSFSPLPLFFSLYQLKSGLYNLQTKPSEKYQHISKQQKISKPYCKLIVGTPAPLSKQEPGACHAMCKTTTKAGETVSNSESGSEHPEK